MTEAMAPEQRTEAKLLGILLSGMFEQTRAPHHEEERAGLESPPSGAYRIGTRGVENTLAESPSLGSESTEPELT